MTLFPSLEDTSKELKAFRVRKDILKELEKAANGMDMPVNRLVNECLVEGLIHITLRNSIAAMTLGREDIMKLLQHIRDESEIERIGCEIGENVPKRLYAIYDIEPSWDSLLLALDLVHSKSCGWFEFKHYVKKDTHRLLFVHEAGQKWTTYLKGYMTGMIRTLLKTEPKVVTATDKMLELII